MALSFDKSYENGGLNSNREELLDLTTVLSPRQAPIYGLLSKQKVSADKVEWTVDSLRDPADVAVLEGVDVDFSAGGSTDAEQFSGLARLDNRVEHFRDQFLVSKKQEVYDSVTPVKLQQAEEKAASQLLRDIEKSIASDNVAKAGSGSTAGKSRGLGEWINNSPDTTNDEATAIPADFVTPESSIKEDASTLTESEFAGLLGSIFNEVGEMQDLHLVADTALRNHIVDEFTRADSTGTSVRYNVEGSEAVVEYNVELFRGPFGIVKIITANPKCMPESAAGKHDRGYILDPSLLAWGEALSMGSTMLEDRGAGPRGYIDCMGTLICKGPNGLGKIADIDAAS
jgi:hypothetical protein